MKSGATSWQKKKKNRHFNTSNGQLEAGQSGYKHWTKAKREQKNSPIIQSTHLNLICQTRAPLSPIPINSSAPSNRHAESPPVPQLMAHKALRSSNPLIAWGCISVTVAKFSPKLELYYFTVQKSAGFLKELTANHLLTLSNLISPNCHHKIWLWNKQIPLSQIPWSLWPHWIHIESGGQIVAQYLLACHDKLDPAFLTLTMCVCDIATYNKYILRGCKFTFLFYCLIWTIFEVFIEFCFCFMFWFFGHRACGILAPQAGI